MNKKYLILAVNYLQKIFTSHFFLWTKVFFNRFKYKYNFKYSKHKVISRDKGFKIISFQNNINYKKAIEYIKRNLNTKELTFKQDKKSDNALITRDIILKENSSIFNLAIDKEILAIVSNYFRTLPILYKVQIWKSIPRQKILGSELFHFDREDIIQMKVFIPLKKVNKNSGPLTLLSASQSKEFIFNNLLKLKFVSLKDRFNDNFVFSRLKKPEINEMTTKDGEVIFADTTNCIHYGSRKLKDSKFQIMLHYVTPFSPKVFREISKINKVDLNSLSYIRTTNFFS